MFVNSEEEQELGSYDKQDKAEELIESSELRRRGDNIRKKMGVLGKLHNIVVHIRASPLRTQQFIDIADKMVPLDNRTR